MFPIILQRVDIDTGLRKWNGDGSLTVEFYNPFCACIPPEFQKFRKERPAEAGRNADGIIVLGGSNRVLRLAAGSDQLAEQLRCYEWLIAQQEQRCVDCWGERRNSFSD